MHYYYLVTVAAVVRADQASFTYSSKKILPIGSVVLVPVGRKKFSGVIISKVAKPSFATKLIEQQLAEQPLPAHMLPLAQWLSDYYAAHLGQVWQAILPAGLHKKRRAATKILDSPQRKRTKIVLNAEQQAALESITALETGTVMLHGVTGAGKTQVYIEAAKRTMAEGKSSLVLVPEIALTPQLIAEFQQHFASVITTHSRMSESARHLAWQQALAAEGPIIVIGPRSALFMPIQKLGLVVVDECHEPSYKQEQQPKYSALRAATMLGRFAKATAVLGSATPSVVDYYLASQASQPIVTLAKPAIATSPPQVQLVDLRKRDQFREHRFLSDKLIADVRQALEAGGQSLLFHNRRGTAPTTLCQKCGWSALCPKCQLPLTLHADTFKLLCHACASAYSVPSACPSCGNADIVFRGVGTKLIESEIKKLFPTARVARFDADNATDETLQARYQELYDGDIDILIGTQLLAKGLDLPKLQVVGVIQADSGLRLPDYQSAERVFQLLYQVAGRVGRGNKTSNVVVQTYQPDHHAIQFALQRNYQAFYNWQLRERQHAKLPPFTYLLKLVCAYKTEKGAIQAAQKLRMQIAAQHPKVLIHGPIPAFYERLNNTYRWQLLISSTRRSSLLEIARIVPAPWQVDIDPASIL